MARRLARSMAPRRDGSSRRSRTLLQVTTRLILIAHAATTATRVPRFGLDEDLDARGRTDAEAAVCSLDGRARVTCGHARRCRQTAEVFTASRRPDQAPTLDGRLDDWDLGSWAGRTLEEVDAHDPGGTRAWLADPLATPHGGESLAGLLTRVGCYLADMADRPGFHVAITHPAIVRAAVVRVLDAPPAAFWRVDVSPLARVSLSAFMSRWNVRFPA